MERPTGRDVSRRKHPQTLDTPEEYSEMKMMMHYMKQTGYHLNTLISNLKKENRSIPYWEWKDDDVQVLHIVEKLEKVTGICEYKQDDDDSSVS